MGPDLLLLILLLVLNGIFSMTEIAIFSSKKVRLESLAKKGDKAAKQALKLSSEPTRFLSTVQVGITLIGILTGAISGAQVKEELALWLGTIPAIAPYAHTVALSTVVFVLTLLSILIGELLPKKIALNNPEGTARVLAGPMVLVATVFYPVVSFLTATTELLVKALRLKPQDEPSVTEEEIKSLITQGTNLGEFEAVEQDLIERVFSLGDRRVGSLMTHRNDVEWLDLNDSFELNRDTILKHNFTSFPLCNEEIDKVEGIIFTKPFLLRLSQGQQPFELAEMAVKPIFVPENMTAFKVMEIFKERKTRIAVVVDEFGTVQGLVTMHDLIEALIGELNQNTADEEPEIVEREDGSYLIDAMLPFEEFLQYFEIEEHEDDDFNGFHTLGGFILHLKQDIPTTGEVFGWRNYRLEVIDMDGNRIDKVLVTELPEGSTASED